MFLILLAIGIPICFVLGSTTLLAMFYKKEPLFFLMLSQRIFAGMDMYVLLAIPLFILAGQVMGGAGLTDSIVRFSDALLGRLRGGLSYVNVCASVFFGGISGAPIADVASIGSILIPAMEKEGYDLDFSAAITASSSIIGAMIPPSILMIIYASVMNISVAAMFAGGIIPGLLVAGILMALCAYYSKKKNYPKREHRISFREFVSISKTAIIPLTMPFIIIGGILTGVFSPTEAAGVAAAYGFLAGVLMKTLTLSKVKTILVNTVVTSSVILFLIATAKTMSWLLTMEMIPQRIAAMFMSVTTNTYLFLFLVNMLLFVVGMVMDPGVAIIILGPVLAPTAVQLGISSLHFALIMTINLIVGLVTPPLGFALYTTCGIAKISLERLTRTLIPFVAVEMGAVFLVTYVPFLTLFIPKMLGLAT
ncbi:MAG: TRAP transporter large permease [Deltaproteobacteria bacterium]|nr:MAG: TRAP transporter large permease [Deltaproteobacteria bacterium]